MKRVLLLTVLIIAGLAVLPLAGQAASGQAPAPTLRPLPARATVTPRPGTPLAPPGAPATPFATSPFVFPTALAPTPARDCTLVFPLDSIERIRLGKTTLAQLQAAFGRPSSVSGRPTLYTFEDEGCTLSVQLGADEALIVEANDYGTLDLLLERYGPPDVVGSAQGNLTLLRFDVAVLLYADEGLVAIFDAPPDELTRQTPIATLQFRPPYTLDRQIRRLNLLPVEDWRPPLR